MTCAHTESHVRAYRLLLRTYPREFRERFARDLEIDFLEMARSRGAAFAWRRALSDVFRAVPLTASDAAAERARTARIGGPIVPPGESFMRSLLFDLRHGFRALVKAPAFTVVTILTLALGIGANSAIFTLVNAALVRPLGFQDPERLMLIYESIPGSGRDRFGVSPADYIDLLQYQQSLSSVGAYRTTTVELSGGGEPEQVDAATITASLFDVLGVKAAEGRTFLAGEDQSLSGVAIISHGLAARHFAGRSPVGATIAIDRQPFTVVGVMPSGFEFPRRGASSNATPADVWMPLVFTPSERQARGSNYNLSVIGRIREGAPPAQAGADLSALATRIRDNYPADLPLKVTIGTLATQGGAVGAGEASTSHSVRCGCTRAARHLRERREPDPEPLAGAATRHRRARGARRRTAAAVPGPAQRSPPPCDVRGCTRTRPRVLGRARDPGDRHHEPPRRQHHLARLARRCLHERDRARQRGALRARAARRRTPPGSARSAPRSIHAHNRRTTAAPGPGDAGRNQRRVRVHPAGQCRALRSQLQESGHDVHRASAPPTC